MMDDRERWAMSRHTREPYDGDESVDDARARADMAMARMAALVIAMGPRALVATPAQVILERTPELRKLAEAFVERGELRQARDCFQQIASLTRVVSEIACALIDKRNEVKTWQSS